MSYTLNHKLIIQQMSGETCLYIHDQSKARIVTIKNNDENRVFGIAFSTPVENDKGIPHILEHSVFSGSKKYPLKEPFNNLMKGSMHTYLNALTYDDFTCFPVASLNLHDFKNLMDVYLDAVFHPLVKEKEVIFQQEGWHYECVDGKLNYNGVVFNEMRGMEASMDHSLIQAIKNSLYPDTCYRYVAGGVPQNIVELSYEELCAFHDAYYHPSNAVIILYGNLDMEERLQYLEDNYLSHYQQKQEVKLVQQNKFSTLKRYTSTYAIDQQQLNDTRYQYAYNFHIADHHDPKLMMAFMILDTVLISSGSGTIRNALMKAGICEDVDSFFNDDIMQPSYSIIMQEAKENVEDEFIEIVQNELKNIIKNGLNQGLLEAAIQSNEFSIREEDYGSTPKGIVYMKRLLPLLLYKEDHVLESLELISILEEIKEDAKHGYFEKIIQNIFFDNVHSSIVSLKPDPNYLQKRSEAIQTSLQDINDHLTKEEYAYYKEKQNTLDAFRQMIDDEETLARFPTIDKEDLLENKQKIYNEKKDLDGNLLLYHDLDTRGIVYFNMAFDLKRFSYEDLSYIALLNEVIGLVSTKKYHYLKLNELIGKYSGGMYSSIKTYQDYKNNKLIVQLELKSRYLIDTSNEVMELWNEMLHHSNFFDEVRILELLKEIRSSSKSYLLNSGHQVALNIILSQMSEDATIQQQVSGLAFYEFLDDCVKHFDEKKDMVMHKLDDLCHEIFTKESCYFSLGVSRDLYDQAMKPIETFVKKLELHSMEEKMHVQLEKRISVLGCAMPSQVQYVAMAGQLKDDVLAKRGHYMVLHHILDSDYLWQNVRIMGGAYGCFSAFGKTGIVAFVSYRDPNIEKTIDCYRKVIEFIEHFDVNERAMKEYIIGTINRMESQMNNPAKITFSNVCYITNVDEAYLQRVRKQIIETTCEDIRALAPFVKEALVDALICVVGNLEELKKYPEFKRIDVLPL